MRPSPPSGSTAFFLAVLGVVGALVVGALVVGGFDDADDGLGARRGRDWAVIGR
jgi:hypothetical protein